MNKFHLSKFEDLTGFMKKSGARVVFRPGYLSGEKGVARVLSCRLSLFSTGDGEGPCDLTGA